jgi:hypothetical protein
MTSLSWLRHAEPDERLDAPQADAPVWPVLAELEVITANAHLRGWIAPEGERTSDWMNRGEEIELIGATHEPLPEPSGPLADADPSSGRLRLAVAEILFAVPPTLPVGRHLRLHRRVHGIHFESGDYNVHGRIHVRPGAQVGDYLLRSNRVFVPITDVDLEHRGEPRFRRRLPVLIVNARHVSRLYSGEGGRAVSAAIDGAMAIAGGGEPHESAPETDVPQATPAAAEPDDDQVEPVRGDVHRALGELAALREDGLITVREYRAKRKEILARL